MYARLLLALGSSLLATAAHAQAPVAPATQLTIYNGDFAVARTMIDLDLKAGVTEVLTTQVTRALEPDSVMLRDPTGRNLFRVTEQSYDAAVINQAALLKKFEGQELDFERTSGTDGRPPVIVHGRVLRAGGENNTQPLIEVDGHMQFQLPGLPLFSPATNGSLLAPTLRWKIESAKPAHIKAELAYVTRQLSWEATYNVIAFEATGGSDAEKADLTGWVTIKNQSGTDFPDAEIKLVAGDMAKLPEPQQPRTFRAMVQSEPVPSQVTQQAVGDFHLYDLPQRVSLADGAVKQVQFLTAPGVALMRTYVYESGDRERPYFANGQFNADRNFGLTDDTSVAVKQEFENSAANHLGVPLPGGRMRIYQREQDGQLVFSGEAVVPRTASQAMVSLTTGNAFDVKGKRTQTDFRVDNNKRQADESFEIKLTNQKPQTVRVEVIERMNRSQQWEIRSKSGPFTKVDSNTVQFPVEVPAKGDATLTYTVHYSW